jgi:hypothetical protein
MMCDCGAVGGMRIGRGNKNTHKSPAEMSFCPSNSHMILPGIELGRSGGSLSYGTVCDKSRKRQIFMDTPLTNISP